MTGLYSAGLYPVPESPQTMYQSVTWYWKRLKSIGVEFKPYNPCDKTYGYGRGAHNSSCTFEKCFGDFGIVNNAEATLKQFAHEDVFTHLQSVSRKPHNLLTSLTGAGRVSEDISLMLHLINQALAI